MTPAELLAVDSKVTLDLNYLEGCYYYFITTSLPEEVQDSKIQIKELAYRYGDGRRFHRTCVVYFENIPVAFIQNAGREGDDFSKLFFLDKEKYKEMDRYLTERFSPRTSSPEPEPSLYLSENVDLNTDMPELTEYYFEEVFPS